MNNKVIGVEGQVSSGKTSMCKELIKLIPNCVYLDAGYIYRGIVLAIAKNKIDLSKTNLNPFELMNKLKVDFKIEENITHIYIDGKKISDEEIESFENSLGVSQMASKSDNTALFSFAKNIIDMYKEKFNVIFSGRDILNMYPSVDLHLFITASIEKRVERRYKQYDGKYSKEEIRKAIEQRDLLHEKSNFNKHSNVTIELDLTDCNSAEESAKKAIKIIKDKGLLQ